jgi:hypothetical protein
MKLSRLQEVLLALFVIALIGIYPTIATLLQTTTISNYATIRVVGVAFFWDHAATQPVKNITWGLVDPSSNSTKLLYCENIKNSNVTLTLAVGGWNPANAGLYMSAGWNYSGAILQPKTVIPVQFQLQVFANATSSGITSFSYNYTATAHEHS